MKTSYCITIITALLFSLVSCTSQQNDQLTPKQKEQIKKEVKAVGDSIISRIERMDVRWVDYYVDSPDWGMVNADGSRWDFKIFNSIQPEFFNSIVSWKWTSVHQDFKFISKDIVIYAWDGKDVTVMKSGDRITYDPHAYTLILKKIDGQWKVIYSHDSGSPVVQKADKK